MFLWPYGLGYDLLRFGEECLGSACRKAASASRTREGSLSSTCASPAGAIAWFVVSPLSLPNSGTAVSALFIAVAYHRH